jgi:hypothetical protein
MSKEEEIKKLSEQLLKLINTPDTPPAVNSSESISLSENDLVSEIVDKLNRLNVDQNHVRQIMRRVDEVYGKAHHNYTTPLHEEFTKLIKE